MKIDREKLLLALCIGFGAAVALGANIVAKPDGLSYEQFRSKPPALTAVTTRLLESAHLLACNIVPPVGMATHWEMRRPDGRGRVVIANHGQKQASPGYEWIEVSESRPDGKQVREFRLVPATGATGLGDVMTYVLQPQDMIPVATLRPPGILHPDERLSVEFLEPPARPGGEAVFLVRASMRGSDAVPFLEARGAEPGGKRFHWTTISWGVTRLHFKTSEALLPLAETAAFALDRAQGLQGTRCGLCHERYRDSPLYFERWDSIRGESLELDEVLWHWNSPRRRDQWVLVESVPGNPADDPPPLTLARGGGGGVSAAFEGALNVTVRKSDLPAGGEISVDDDPGAYSYVESLLKHVPNVRIRLMDVPSINNQPSESEDDAAPN